MTSEKVEFEYRFDVYDLRNKTFIVNKLLRFGGEKVHDYMLYPFVVFHSPKNTYIRLRKEYNGVFLTEKTYDGPFADEKETKYESFQDALKTLVDSGYRVKY